MRISDWSSDVCSSDLRLFDEAALGFLGLQGLEGGELDGAPDARFVLSNAELARDLAELAEGVGQHEIGRASCRERVCQYVWISVVAVSLKKKTTPTR